MAPSHAIRADASVMLNLEEINMTEDELIRSYDPENEENNYHMPHHLVKKIQLEQHRPVCSEVIKNALFISSHVVAADLETLQRHGITHVVNTAADVCANHFPGHFHYLTYFLKDGNSEEISIHFYRTIKWVDDAIQQGGRVLIHCREGVSRSSTMVIAYLMWRYSLPFETAHDRLRKVRSICNPNTGFTCQLLVLAKRLGITGQQAPPSDRTVVYRVAPYHPMQPFLLLLPVEGSHWSISPNFDPRFGWMVQRGLETALWIGAQVVDAEAAQSAVREHLSWLKFFERLDVQLSIVQDGLESPHFWNLLGLPGAPADRCKFTSQRPGFDADAAILANARGASARPTVADDVEISSPREDYTQSSAACPEVVPPSAVDRPVPADASGRQSDAARPRPTVPSLALGGLRSPDNVFASL
jgi:predicted protein tyrosine phosphatase